MKHVHESFHETLTRLLGHSPRPASARMESGIERVWDRLQAEIVADTPGEIAPSPFVVRRSWTPRVGLVEGTAVAHASLVTLLAAFVRSLLHGGSSMDE
jgi:hypothetical protein